MLKQNIIELKEKIEGGDKSFEELKKMGEKLIEQAHKEKSNKLYCEVAKLYELIYHLKEDEEFVIIIANAYLAIGQEKGAIYWITKYLKFVDDENIKKDSLTFAKMNRDKLLYKLLENEKEIDKLMIIEYDEDHVIEFYEDENDCKNSNSFKGNFEEIIHIEKTENVAMNHKGKAIHKIEIYSVTEKDYKLNKQVLYSN